MTLDLADTSAPVTDGRRRRRADRTGLRLGGASGLSLGLVTTWLSIVVLIPLIAVVGKAFGRGWDGFTAAVTQREARSALTLTIELALAVAIVNAVAGTTVAWVLVRDRFRGKGLFEVVIDIPFALPTIVTGLVAIALYGPGSPIGLNLQQTRLGLFAVLLFVTLPFTVRTVQPVLLDLDRDAEQAAASLGASGPAVFKRIVLPQILPAVASGAALSFARALGEYGSLVFLSSNIPNKTEIASSLIYGKLQANDNPALETQQAAALATILLVASAVVLIVLDLLQRRIARR